MVLDIALLVILVFSFMEASMPVIKSTKMRNNTANITVTIGDKKAAIRKRIFFINSEKEKLSKIDWE